MNIDERLHTYGYAPGEYFFKCFRCKQQDIGEKRSLNCKKCAMEYLIKALDEKVEQLEEYKQKLAPIHSFLLGATPLNGTWFDECVTNFSWRSELYKAINDSELEVKFTLKEK